MIINNHEDYEINEKGEVYSLIKKKLLKPHLNFTGSIVVSIGMNGSDKNKRKVYCVNKLVMEHFNTEYKGGTIKHKDGDKNNCHIDNLYEVEKYKIKVKKEKTILKSFKTPKIKNSITLPKKIESSTEVKRTYKKHYINDNSLTYEIILCKGMGKATGELVKMFILIVDNVIKKKQYDYDMKSDVKQDAIFNLIKNFKNFNEKKYENSLPYVTELIKRSLAFTYQNNTGRISKGEVYKNIKFISISNLYNQN